MGFFGGERAVLNEMTAAWETARTTRGIGSQRAQMYIGSGGLLRAQYGDNAPVTIANLAQPVSSAAAVPVGAVFQWVLPMAPVGYLLCDGRSVSATEYPELFALIGTTFGEGSGIGSFKLPNMGGRVPVGAGLPSFPDLFTGSLGVGAIGGSPAMEISSRHMPEHSHGIDALEHSHSIQPHDHATNGLVVEAHTHEIDFTTSSAYDVTGGVLTDLTHDHDLDMDLSVYTDGPRQYTDEDGTSNSVAIDLDHSHSATVKTAAGSDTATVSSGGGHAHTVVSSGTANSAGGHYHDIASAATSDDGDHTHAVDLELSGQGAHGHTINFDAESETGSGGTHTHAVAVASAGAHDHDLSTSGGNAVMTDDGAHTHSIDLDSSTEGAHGHDFTGSQTGTAGNHTHYFDVDDVTVDFDYDNASQGRHWDTDIVVSDTLQIQSTELASATVNNISATDIDLDTGTTTLSNADVAAHTESFITSNDNMTIGDTFLLGTVYYSQDGFSSSNTQFVRTWDADSDMSLAHNHTVTVDIPERNVNSTAHDHTVGGDITIGGGDIGNTDHTHTLNGGITVDHDLQAGLVVQNPETGTMDSMKTDEAGSHSHTVTGSISNTDGAHAHDVDGSTASAGGHTHTLSGTTEDAGAHTHAATATATWANGGTSAHTHAIDADSIGATITSDGAHGHDVDGTTAGGGSHSHTLDAVTETDGAHTHTVNTTGTTAASGPHTHTIDLSDEVVVDVGLSGDDLKHHHTISGASAGGTSGETALDHYHVLDNGSTGYQEDAVYLNGSLGDSGTLTTDDVIISAGNRTEMEGEAYPERMEIMQPYLVMAFIIKAA